MAGAKRLVYVIRDAVRARTFYVGLTSDVFGRLAEHNLGHQQSGEQVSENWDSNDDA